MNNIRSSYLSLGVLILSFICLYYPVISKMILDWSRDENYRHGFFIPLIAGFLIWRRRERLSEIKITSSGAGLVLLLGGLGVFVLGQIGAELFTMRFSMVFVIWALCTYIAGLEFGKTVFVPILYLVFMIPIPAIIWNKVAFPLQLFASRMTATFIQGIGISVLQEGNILNLPHSTLQVTDACSGLRSLASLLAMSSALALVTKHSTPSKWILFLSAIPIAVLINILRLMSTAILSEHYGEAWANGRLHELTGIMGFVLAIALLYGVHRILKSE